VGYSVYKNCLDVIATGLLSRHEDRMLACFRQLFVRAATCACFTCWSCLWPIFISTPEYGICRYKLHDTRYHHWSIKVI